MIRRLFRFVGRWHHRAHARDCAFMLRVLRAHLRDLPAEIARIEKLERYHDGQAATLCEARDPVNFRLGSARSLAINAKKLS